MSKTIEVLESELRYAQSTSDQIIREIEAIEKRYSDLTKQLDANEKVVDDLKDGLEAIKTYRISEEVRERLIRTKTYINEPSP